ncbi:interferon gamma receptor 1 isoform X2 [Sphaerodactylus townsendi]|nr:interferon gamma receptor 1 isoform X2 [Sphaerodactylus townsendi]
MDVRSCVNISQHYCDITHEINYECDPSWAKVKAFAGSRQSEYEDSKKFHPFRDAQIGPSKFNLSVVSDEIKVFIEHPLTPYEGKYPLSVKANLTDFSYSILLWKQASPHKIVSFEAEECEMDFCTKYLPVSLGFTYCVSVQGISKDYSVEGEKSNASCIILPAKHPLDVAGSIIGVVAVAVAAAVGIAVVLACKWAKRRNIPLPKSLVSIVRSIKPANSFETRTEGKYTAISSLNCYPAREDEKPEEPIEHLTEVETSDLEVSGKTAVESQTIQEASAGESCENELSHEDSDSYFKSVSDQEKICDSLPNEGVPRADVQQSTDLGACRKMSGYDKPHWMIPDTGGCEPPIA